jgi:hypothetical protein
MKDKQGNAHHDGQQVKQLPATYISEARIELSDILDISMSAEEEFAIHEKRVAYLKEDNALIGYSQDYQDEYFTFDTSTMDDISSLYDFLWGELTKLQAKGLISKKLTEFFIVGLKVKITSKYPQSSFVRLFNLNGFQHCGDGKYESVEYAPTVTIQKGAIMDIGLQSPFVSVTEEKDENCVILDFFGKNYDDQAIHAFFSMASRLLINQLLVLGSIYITDEINPAMLLITDEAKEYVNPDFLALLERANWFKRDFHKMVFLSKPSYSKLTKK